MSLEFAVGQAVLYTCSSGYRREMTVWAKSLDQRYLLSVSFSVPIPIDGFKASSCCMQLFAFLPKHVDFDMLIFFKFELRKLAGI